jgi:hypothetical protein
VVALPSHGFVLFSTYAEKDVKEEHANAVHVIVLEMYLVSRCTKNFYRSLNATERPTCARYFQQMAAALLFSPLYFQAF